MPACPTTGELVEKELENLPTQYREAWKLHGYMRAGLAEIEAAAHATCAIPTYFDLDTAVGDQLTIIGKWMGLPRCHCICTPNPMFGFAYEDVTFPSPIVGFCAGGNWAGCDGGSLSEYCLSDDETYRAFLQARRYQMLGLFDRESLVAALRHVWGEGAWIVHTDLGRVVVAPGRPLSTDEVTQTQILARILPVAPGIHLGLWLDQRPIFGFGEGWAGMCGVAENKINVFGFDCEDGQYAYNMTGFCAPDSTWANCVPASAAAGFWLCPTDPTAPC